MKTIKIKSMKLTNFKGIRSLELKNLSKDTFIYGDNGVGKTSIFDAFTWLLFGKDSTDRKDFEIKTLNSRNQVIPKIDHEVEAIIEVNGECMELRRIFREKWVKRKGALESEFSGNETVYEWNGVPMNAGDYMTKINNIVDEKVFKMITNPAAFNSLKWQDQRDVLIDMAGTITNEDVASGNIDFQALLSQLTNKTLEEYGKQIKASISKSKAEIKMIPTRIDEVERGKPEALDFEALRKDLSEKNKDIESVNDQISDKLKAQQADLEVKSGIQRNIYTIENEINGKRNELQQIAANTYSQSLSKPQEIQRNIDSVDREIQDNEQTVKMRNQKIESHLHQVKLIDEKMKSLRDKWTVENARKFEMGDDDCACPTCKRAFDMKDIEEKRSDLEAFFISNQNANKRKIEKDGQDLGAEKVNYQNQINTLKEDIQTKEASNLELWKKRADLSETLKPIGTNKSQSEIYNELIKENETFFNGKKKDIDALKESLSIRTDVENTELKQKLSVLNGEADAIKSKIQNEVTIKSANARIESLLKEENTLAQSIANMEKEQYVIDAFEKEKSTRIEESVNQRFSMVNFKLFETQINGGEVPTCKALINGVPFSDANTASKINAGLDIINTLCLHYEANAPIFIDNRESVIELIPTESQVINLIVSEADKKLRVEDMPLNDAQNAIKRAFESQSA